MREPTGLHIRPHHPADLPILTRLNAYGLAAAGVDPDADAYGGQDFANFERTYTPAHGGIMLVGEVDRAVVAMGGIRRLTDHQCELMRMRVFPDHQGRGYGKAILFALEDHARALGYQSVRLLTGSEQHPAIDLYLANGYRITEHLHAGGIPSVHMEKQLLVSDV